MTTGNNIMWKKGEIAPKEQFLHYVFHIIIYIYRSQITYSFVKCVVQFIVFLTLSTQICRGTDISKCFCESLGIPDNESRLYLEIFRCTELAWWNNDELRLTANTDRWNKQKQNYPGNNFFPIRHRKKKWRLWNKWAQNNRWTTLFCWTEVMLHT